jgi:hypothetical protein
MSDHDQDDDPGYQHIPHTPDFGSGWVFRPSDAPGDYHGSKSGLGKIFPDNQIYTDGWEAEDSLITPEQLRKIHLFGLPLISSIQDPFTGKPSAMEDTELRAHIIEAVSLAELECSFAIFPKQILEKKAFDKAEYDSFGYMQLRHRPVTSLQSITVTPSNEQTVYEVPLEWVDVGLLHQGQLNLIPLTIALKSGTVVGMTASAGGAMFLSIFGNRPWIPSFFEVRYTIGFPEGKLPKTVNQLIGVVAAMEILSLLAATYSRSTSSSLSFDGISQSVSTPGPEIFTQRLKELGLKRQWLIRKLQRYFGLGVLVDNV